ncbi:MAG: amidase family protein, partial [Planctomycetota bacterium]|nr:amidase family protein [Planctomycetota bacterium]
MNSKDLCFLSALDLKALYKRRDLSPVELVKAVLDQIDELSPRLNAIVTATPDLALRQARAAEKAYAEEDAPAPLLGIPGSLKDLTPTAGIRTARGSLLHKDWIPDYNAPLVDRL